MHPYVRNNFIRKNLKKLLITLLLFTYGAQARELSLMSYNTWLLPSILMSSHMPHQRAIAIANYLKENPKDIIALQEIFTKKDFRVVPRMIKCQKL